MKKLLFIFLIPIFSFTQNGDTNGDGFVNLEDLFNVLENWLSEYPDSVATIEDFSNILDSIETVFENISATSNGINILFPEGIGEPITFSVEEGTPYIVPLGKRLYINQLYSGGGEASIDDISISYNSNASNGSSLSVPLILNSGQEFSRQENGYSSFNGFLVDETELLEALTVDISDESYTVPEGKRLYVTNLKSNGAQIMIDDIIPIASNPGNSSGSHLGLPIILNAGQQIVHNQYENGIGAFNGYLVDEDYFSSVSNSNFNNIQSSLENNTSIQVNDSDYYDFNDCNYINSLDYGSIVHNALQGLTAVVLPGKQCGSSVTSMFTFTSSGTNSFDTRDFLWCFSVNDTIALTTIPALNYGGATNLYLLEDSLTNYDPNTDCEADSDQFIYGSVQHVMYSLLPKEVILLPENIYGLRIDGSGGSNTSYMHYGVSIQTTETINNLGLWENQYPDYEWQLTNYFPLIGSPGYYPYGKRFKYF